MLKLVTGMQGLNKAFTLIELLVVLLIIGITVSFGLLAVGDFGEKRRIISYVEQFSNDIKLLQQKAILENSTFGIHILNNGYEILRFNYTTNLWAKDQSLGMLQHVTFKHPINVKLPYKHSNPEIIINSLGELNTASIDFGTKQKPNIINFSINANKIRLQANNS